MTSRGVRSRITWCRALVSRPSSWSRPDHRRSRRRARRAAAAPARGPATPRSAWCGPRSVIGGLRRRSGSRSGSAAWVAPQTSTPPAGASDCSRAAVLTTSPATIACPPSWAAATSTSASPVAMPTRKVQPAVSLARRGPARAAGPARPARTAPRRSRWPPARRTAPSPRRRCTSPPRRRTGARPGARWRRSAVCCARTVSGSACSANGVEPTASMNSTLTRRRSSAGALAAGVVAARRSGWPQPVQKTRSAGCARPQRGQTDCDGVAAAATEPVIWPAARPQRGKPAGRWRLLRGVRRRSRMVPRACRTSR